MEADEWYLEPEAAVAPGLKTNVLIVGSLFWGAASGGVPWLRRVHAENVANARNTNSVTVNAVMSPVEDLVVFTQHWLDVSSQRNAACRDYDTRACLRIRGIRLFALAQYLVTSSGVLKKKKKMKAPQGRVLAKRL